jgi:SAM-dependent methyltransferase
MALWAPLPRAAGVAELLDGPAPFLDLSQCLADLARFNNLGGRRPTLAHVKRLLRRVPANRVATVLDLGTGGADIPRALVRWARRTSRPLRVLALDRDAATLRVARQTSAGFPEITLLQADAVALPLRARSVDVVMSALTLHHLEPAAASASLAAMDAVARVGFVVSDLIRARAAYASVWLATRLLAKNRMSRHDGPLSVLRAYTPAELRELCRHAGVGDITVSRYPFVMRQCVVRVKPMRAEGPEEALAQPNVFGRAARRTNGRAQ